MKLEGRAQSCPFRRRRAEVAQPRAVHPKQWLPVMISRLSILSGSISQRKSRLVWTLPLHIQLLIKVAIVNLAAPSDANGVTAHESLNRCGVKRIYQQLHVFLQLMIVPQKCRESPDRHVGDRIEFVKHDAEMREKLAFIIGCQ